jgi:hypothetical protein
MTKKKPLKSIERFIRKNIWGFVAEALVRANRIARLDPVEIERMVRQNPASVREMGRNNARVYESVKGVD